MYDDIASDSRLSGFLKRQINLRDPLNPKLKGLKLCGSSIMKSIGTLPAVYLLSDSEEKARFWGTTACHSAWACPKCMPIVMAKKGTDIACAIDALAKQNKYAFMVTFTFPHSKYMSCKDSFEILQKTWRYFTKNKRRAKIKNYTLKLSVGEENHRGGVAVGKAGEVRQYVVKSDPWGAFREDLQIQHSVRVYEFTWSRENGWHPHIHALFWTDKKNFDKITDYEDSLLERWWQCSKRSALSYWTEKYPDKKEEMTKMVEEYYSDAKKHPKTGHKSFFISRDQTGKVRIEQSSFYIAGWSGNDELTASNFKNASEGHFTPYQMLKIAYNNAQTIDEFIPLYLEYCQATFKHRRVEFSKTGINDIIKNWKKTEEFILMFKKKYIQKRGEIHRFKVVYWFSEEQWKQICRLDLTTDEEIIPQLLLLAKEKDCRAKIDKLLEAYDIVPITQLKLIYLVNQQIKFLEEKIFENRMSA